ncbi:hypothetical protein DID88_004995 [Monilinia fructigena]|uniref:BTB domain-containing protein n=1 Tax=Monilinia fructigena TaxID=38457 RepID=A0A395IVQ8_9HELO|nr:hypothetical protein DID88_004995 [Monilinia fructigena]
MDEGLFAFEEDDDYQTSNDEYGDETENQQWERCNMMPANQDEPTSSDIPADQFLSKLDLPNGPTFKIFISTNDDSTQQGFDISKDLLCTHSTFFNCAFNGPFKRSHPQEMHLPETPLSTFQLLVQFLYTNTFTFPTRITSPHEKLTLYLLFFATCHQLHITGLSLIITRFKSLVKWCSERGQFPTRLHMELAMDLPAVMRRGAWPSRRAWCQALMEESADFAADLFRAYTRAVRGALGAHYHCGSAYDEGI